MPKAREPLPTRVALLHVAIHVLAVVFLGHNNVGVHWVHGPSPNWRLSRRTRVFLYFLHDRTIKRFTGIFFAFSLFHFSHASKTDFCGLFALMIPQYFGDPITGFAYTSQDIRRDPPPPPLDRRSCAVVVWRSSDEPFFWVRLFLYLFFFTVVYHASRLATAASSAWCWWWWTWTGGSGRGAAHRGSPSSFFVNRGHCIGVRDISNTLASGTLLGILIQQIQPLP